MGSSTRKKSNKKADFQKPKLKVGKARPKPTNFTDTSFRSKGISLAKQSLATSAPSEGSQFSHALSLLTSRTDSQRRDALASLTTHISTLPVKADLPQPLSLLLPRLSPLLLDGSNAVRAQLLKLLRVLSERHVGDFPPHIEKMQLYIRAGMTHLAASIRSSATEAWIWCLETAPEETVACAGGWVKGLKTLCVVLGWPIVPPGMRSNALETRVAMGKAPGARGGWSNVSATAGHGAQKAGAQPVALLTLLALFLRTGLLDKPPAADNGEFAAREGRWPWMLTDVEAHMLPKRSYPYGYLNLFGEKRDEEGECYRDVEERREVFRRLGFEGAVLKGMDAVREGGEVGRLSGRVRKVLKEGMGELDGVVT